MKVGDLVRIISSKRCTPGSGPSSKVWERYRLLKKDQRIGIVVRMGTSVKQMTVLTQDGHVRFWFNKSCEVVA